MKNQLNLTPVQAAIRYCKCWLKRTQELPIPPKQITSADIRAYRQYLSNHQRRNALL